MLKKISLLFFAVALSCPAHGQVAISASSITDSFENPIASAKLCFQPVNSAQTPVGFRVGSTQIVPNEVCGTVTAGVLASGLHVAPNIAGTYYHLYVKTPFSNQVLRDFGMTSITGSSWSLDTYDPSMAVAPGTIATGTVTPLSYGASPTAGITGGPLNYLLNLGIPAGPPGANGHDGTNGTNGTNGSNGAASVNQIAPLVDLQLPAVRNLFNGVITCGGGVNGSDGTLFGGDGTHCYTPMMAVPPGGQITESGIHADITGYAFYDIAGTYISGASTSGSDTFTVPSNAAYFRISYQNFGGWMTTLMIVPGSSVPGSYIGYGYDDPVTAATKTATAVSTALAAADTTSAPALANGAIAEASAGLPVVRNLFDPNTLTAGGAALDGSGNVTGAPSNGYLTGFSPVTPGASLYTSATSQSNSYAFYDVNKVFISGHGYAFGVSGVITNPLTVPAGAYYARVGVFDFGSFVEGNTWMINQGSSLAAYQPFGYRGAGPEAEASAAAIATQHTADLARFIPLYGKKFGVFGDSISSIFSQAWQNVVHDRTGATLQFQDARPGRGIGQMYECYQATNGATVGTYSTSGLTSDCGVYGDTGQTTGHTLAQDLASVDLIFVEDGTNDYGPCSTNMGTPGDSIASGTCAGYVRWVLENLLSANHNMHVMWIGPQDASSTSHASSQALVAMQKGVCAIYGVPYLDLSAVGGGSTFNASWYTQGDGVHPSSSTFANFYGPIIAQFAQQYF